VSLGKKRVVMNQKKIQLLKNLRIVLAIAWKDILEGWKNKIILTSILTAIFLVAFYTYLPDLTRGDELPLLVIYDPEEYIENKDTVNLTDFNHRVESEENIFFYELRDHETPVIGVKLEQDPHQSKSTSPLILQGYTPYWMNSAQVESIKSSAEVALQSVLNTSVRINTDGNIVYPIMDNHPYGKTFVATAGLLVQLALLGLSMAPQLIVEEKENQTLQAIIVSPANFMHFILGKTLAVLFYTTLTTIIGLIFVGPLVIHWGLVLLSLFIGMSTLILPGILLGVLLKSKGQIQIWIWVMFIPIILPIFFSIVRILPKWLMNIIDWWPTVALARLLRAGFTLNPPLNTYGGEIIYLLSLSLVVLLITLWIVKQQTIKGN
jgi:ABC-type transport system involved in cytochrome c biogenesis permease component